MPGSLYIHKVSRSIQWEMCMSQMVQPPRANIRSVRHVSLQWGTSGSGDGQFEYPQGIAVDTVGNVYVADTENNRIQKLIFRAHYWHNGDVQVGMASSGSNRHCGQFVRYVYVMDTNNNRVQIFDPSGTYLFQWEIPEVATGSLNLQRG